MTSPAPGHLGRIWAPLHGGTRPSTSTCVISCSTSPGLWYLRWMDPWSMGLTLQRLSRARALGMALNFAFTRQRGGTSTCFAADFLPTNSACPHGPQARIWVCVCLCKSIWVLPGSCISYPVMPHRSQLCPCTFTTLSHPSPHNVVRMSPDLHMKVQARGYVSGWAWV